MTGIRVTLYTNIKELEALKDGKGKELRAVVAHTNSYSIKIDAPLEACTFIDSEVRVNVTESVEAAEKLSRQMGEIMAQALAAEVAKMEG